MNPEQIVTKEKSKDGDKEIDKGYNNENR